MLKIKPTRVFRTSVNLFEPTRNERTTPYRHTSAGQFGVDVTPYESHELVSDQYDRAVNRGLKYKREFKQRMQSNKMYDSDRVCMSQQDIDRKKYVDAQMRAFRDKAQ